MMTLNAAEPIELSDITSGKFAAKYVTGITPLANSNEYAQISQDGCRIERYSFKSGKQTGVLFDVADTKEERISEFDGYDMSADGKLLLIQTDTKRIYRHSFTAEYYVYSVTDKTLRKLSPNGAQQVATFSPDNKHIAFVRRNNIFITDGEKEIQVTTDGAVNKIINGIPDWVNEEEFGFNNAMAWSSDGSSLSWIRYDESKVKTYSLQMFKGAYPTNKKYEVYPGRYSYKYPKAGEANSVVSAWTYILASGQTRQLPVALSPDGYIPRIKTIPESENIAIYTMNRHQDTLCVYAVSPCNVTSSLLIKESVPKYVKEEAMEGILFTKSHILVPSDRDGFMHLYLYDKNGKLLRQVDKGDYDVTEVYGYDEKTGNVYFQAAAKSPMNREVYVVGKSGKKTCLTLNKGWNQAVFSSDFKNFINTWSDRNHPYVFTLCDQRGKVISVMEDNHELVELLASYNLPEKEFFTFTTSEGVVLNGWMIKGNGDVNGNQAVETKHPVIMHQYSGPGSQQVRDSWSIGSMGQGGLFDYYLVQKGFIVVSVDGRGTGGRGSDFEKCTYLKIGDLEAKDQVEAALWLGKQPYVDPSRIGIWGWSYGGFTTLMSMSEGREVCPQTSQALSNRLPPQTGVFRAGVAIAPPTNWRYYDTVYTERYMRTPQENPDGYAINPINRAEQLQGALLICQGLADDNVHPQNTFEYSEALVQADKDFRELVYTNRNHSIYGKNTRNHLLRQVVRHFEKELLINGN